MLYSCHSIIPCTDLIFMVFVSLFLNLAFPGEPLGARKIGKLPRLSFYPDICVGMLQSSLEAASTNNIWQIASKTCIYPAEL